MATNPIESKFEIERFTGDKHGKVYKNFNFAHLSSIYPDLATHDVLEPARRQIARFAKGHLIGENGSLMRVFEDQAIIRDDFQGESVQWTLHTEESDIRPFFVYNFEEEDAESGLANGSFYIGLDTDNLGPNDKFVFENWRDFDILVVSEPEAEEGIWKYECQLLNNGDIDYINLSDIKIGTRIIQTGSLLGEAAVDRGNATINAGNSYIKLEVPFTRMGWSMKVTDRAWMNAEHFKLNPLDDNVREALRGMGDEGLGSPRELLVTNLDEKFWRATNRQIDMHLTYGRSAETFASQFLDGITQNEIKSGPGLYEFLDSVNKDEFSIKNGSLDIFRNFFKRVWLNKVDYQDRVVDVFTGSAGLELVQKWAAKEDIEPVYQEQDTHYKMEEPYFEGMKGVVIGRKQYVGFFIQPFGLVRFHLLPFLDSTAVETRMYEGYPISSYQFMVFNFGYGDLREDSNIYILKNPAYENFEVGIGGWAPYGASGSNPTMRREYMNTLQKENAYEMWRDTSMAFLMRDTSAAMLLQPGVY